MSVLRVNSDWFLPGKELDSDMGSMSNGGQKILCAGNIRAAKFLSGKGYEVIESSTVEDTFSVLAADEKSKIGLLIAEAKMPLGHFHTDKRVPKDLTAWLLMDHLYNNGYNNAPQTIMYTQYLESLKELINRTDYRNQSIDDIPLLAYHVTIMKDILTVKSKDNALLKEIGRQNIKRKSTI